MAGVSTFMTLVHYISVLIIADLGLRVHASCDSPPKVPGTRFNGSLAVYQPGDVLFYGCDTGYNPNYNPPISTCLDSEDWSPPDVTCELDIISIVIAIVSAIVAFVIFAVIIVIIYKIGRRKRNALTSKVTRICPEFPEYQETIEMSRPGSLYDSIKLNAAGSIDALSGLEDIKEHAGETSNGITNPNFLVDNNGIDIIDAGGLKMTGALQASSSRSNAYENADINGKEIDVKRHNYENTPLEKINNNIVVHHYETVF